MAQATLVLHIGHIYLSDCYLLLFTNLFTALSIKLRTVPDAE